MPQSCVYVGLAGDTGPGKVASVGLYRSRDGIADWEAIGEELLPAPEVRAICTDPARPGRVTIGTQAGVFRSDDHGDHWMPLGAPAPELAVWSLLRHPRDPDTMLAGYEPCAIHRTTDDGAHWQALTVDVDFPDITLNPEPQPKRITGMAIDPNEPATIYASIEVGGLLRSLDDGKSWACVTDGLYAVDDAVDLHRVVVSATRPGVVTLIGRIGTFRSTDRGARWKKLPVPRLTAQGTYCRDLVVAPDDPDRLYVAAGTGFEGDKGALFGSADDGRSWMAHDLGTTPRSTIFAFAIDPQDPDRLYCASKGGEFFRSQDRGRSWQANPLPAGASPVYALAVGP
jgi:photosystem II stability/assembly factor-like uncharacterized protein